MTRIALALCGAAAVASALPSTFSVGVPIVVAPTPFIPQNGSGLGFAAASPYIGASGDVWMALNGDGSRLFIGDTYATQPGGGANDGQVFACSLAGVAAGGVPAVQQVLPLPYRSLAGQSARFGQAIAVSADGSVLLVSAPNALVPTVFAYALVGGSYLLAGSFVGEAAAQSAGANFGYSLALAVSNPRIAVVSATNLAGGTASAVYIYARNAAGAWLLADTVASAATKLGSTVGISADGTTAFATQPYPVNRVFVYTLSAAGAVTQTATISGGDYFGAGAALSADGATLAVSTSVGVDVTQFFAPTTPGGLTWAPVGQTANPRFVPAGGDEFNKFASTGGVRAVNTLALTPDGSTIIAAAPENFLGAANGVGWIAVQSKTANVSYVTLQGTPEFQNFGSFVAVNSLPQPGGATTLVVCAGNTNPIAKCYVAMATATVAAAEAPLFWVIGLCTGLGVSIIILAGLFV